MFPICLASEPRTVFGIITALAGLGGTVAGGLLGDRLRARLPGSYFLVSGAGLLLSAPCVLLFLVMPFPWAWCMIFAAVFFMFVNTGPTNTILANVVHPVMRPAGFAVNILVIHVLGDVISPPIIGTVSGFWGSWAGFRRGFGVLWPSAACSGCGAGGILPARYGRLATRSGCRSLLRDLATYSTSCTTIILCVVIAVPVPAMSTMRSPAESSPFCLPHAVTNATRAGLSLTGAPARGITPQ